MLSVARFRLVDWEAPWGASPASEAQPWKPSAVLVFELVSAGGRPVLRLLRVAKLSCAQHHVRVTRHDNKLKTYHGELRQLSGLLGWGDSVHEEGRWIDELEIGCNGCWW